MERDWWVRTLLVLQRPAAVFAALRRADDHDARQEPILAIVLLAGMAGVLATNSFGRLLDDFELDAVVVPILVFVAGGLYGVTAYFGLGALVHLGSRFAGSGAGYRYARHVVAFAAVPLVLSLVVWPVRLAAFGEDEFRSGGSDDGFGGSVFEAIELGAVVWACALLVLGVRVLNRWPWPRALAASLPALAVPVTLYALA